MKNRTNLQNSSLSPNSEISLTPSVGGGPILDHAPLNFYRAKSSGQISSNQNRYCLKIYFYVFYFFKPWTKNKAKAERKMSSQMSCRLFSVYEGVTSLNNNII